METLLAWLLMFAAAAMIVLGILLLAAERELRKQRRELVKIRRNHRTSEAQGSETYPSAELESMTRTSTSSKRSPPFQRHEIQYPSEVVTPGGPLLIAVQP